VASSFCPALSSCWLALSSSMTRLCCVIVSLRFAMSHAISSRLVPFPSPPPEKLKALFEPVNVVTSVFLLELRVILLIAGSDWRGWTV